MRKTLFLLALITIGLKGYPLGPELPAKALEVGYF